MTRTISTVRPRRGLFSVATRVPHTNDIDWGLGGWALRSACPKVALRCCSAGDDPDVAPEFDPPVDVRFLPFSVTDVQGCTAGSSRTPGAMRDAREANIMWHEANIEGWVSAGLEIGACNDAASSLFGLFDATPVPNVAVPLATAVRLLLRHRVNAGVFDRPVLHLPAWYAGELDDSSHLSDVADIVFGPGYGLTRYQSDAFVYITGPVEYSILTPEYRPETTLAERRMNSNYDALETLAVVRFDPCASAKVLIERTL